jgi:hypothetical protein
VLNAAHLRRSCPLSRLSLFVLAGSMFGACSPRERAFRPAPEAGPEHSEPGCHDEIRNGTETDIDCGGVCQRCLYGKTCETNADCRGGVCKGSICAPRTQVFSAMGTTDACCEGPTAYKTIPEMSLELDLDGDYVVLTEFDINVVGGDACWVATRLAVDGTPDPSWTHVQPWGGPDEDDHVHLFRIDALQAGSHRIQAEWGSDSCKMCNTPGAGAHWVRKISAIAIPTSTGVTFGYKHGTGDACTTSSPGVFTPIADLALDFNSSGPSIVLSQFDINWVGSSNSWTAARMVLDDNVDPRWTHTQPQGGNDEDDHVHLARLDFAQEGHHKLVAQWGDGHETMCNPMDKGSGWDRRIGYLAIPLSTGASFDYAVGSTDACRDAGAFEAIPDMSLQRFVSKESIALTHFDINWVGCSGCWSGARLSTDGAAESHWTHTQPQGGGDEDDHVHMHRVDVVSPGEHTFAAEWGDGSGKMCNNASSPFWSRRIGTLLLPVAP